METMKSFIYVISLAGLVGCGGDDLTPKQACDDLSAALCGQFYACLSPAEITAANLPATEPACVTMYQTMLGCAAVTAENSCDGNEVYNGDKAGDCVAQTEGLDCSQIRDQNFDFEMAAPACGQVCTVP